MIVTHCMLVLPPRLRAAVVEARMLAADADAASVAEGVARQ